MGHAVVARGRERKRRADIQNVLDAARSDGDGVSRRHTAGGHLRAR